MTRSFIGSNKVTVVQRNIAIEFAAEPDGKMPVRHQRISCDWNGPVHWECEIRPEPLEIDCQSEFARLVELTAYLAEEEIRPVTSSSLSPLRVQPAPRQVLPQERGTANNSRKSTRVYGRT